jgi:hypothetical protein
MVFLEARSALFACSLILARCPLLDSAAMDGHKKQHRTRANCRLTKYAINWL